MTGAVRKSDAAKPVRLAWSIKELALALGSNYWTIYRLIKAGEIASFKIGGEHRVNLFAVARALGVPPADLDQLLADIEARRAKAKTGAA